MAETTEKTKQVATGPTADDISGNIGYLKERVALLEKYEVEIWEMLGEVIEYLNTFGEQRQKQINEVLKGFFETKLAERYNTSQLQEHFNYHSLSDKKRNTNRYNKYIP